MKAKKLISLSSALFASALLFACAKSTTKQGTSLKQEEAVENVPDEKKKENPSNTDSNIKTVTIKLRGAVLDDASQPLEFKVRRGTLWNAIKKKVPQKEDFVYPDSQYIGEVTYSTNEEGTEFISDNTSISNDMEVFVNISHVEPETGGIKVDWYNDDGSTALWPQELYRVGEKPYYKGPTPKSAIDISKTFDGWSPMPSEIEEGSDPIKYTAHYHKDVETFNFYFDLNYEGSDEPITRTVPAGGYAEPLKPEPTRDHYTFGGWYETEACVEGEEFDFDSTPIASDGMTVYAKWNIFELNVTVRANGGEFTGETERVYTVGYGTTWKDIYSEHGPDGDGELVVTVFPEEASEENYVYKYYDAHQDTWETLNPDDENIIENDLLVKVFYESKIINLSFDDEYTSLENVLPETKEITYGKKWADIKNDCMPTETEGYTFDHYYYKVDGGDPITVGDNFIFDSTVGESITFYVVYEVTIEFDCGEEEPRGYVDYKSDKFLTGTKWENADPEKYKPHVFDEDLYKFNYYRTDEHQEITNDYVIKKSETFFAEFGLASEPDSFINDSWDVFLNYIDGKTFSQIATPGEPYYDDYEGHGNTFVGLEREVKIYGTTYQVRVVDENNDDQSATAISTQGKGLFTFEFVNLVNFELPYSINPENNYYGESFLHNYLTKSFINGFPTNIRNKMVMKYNETFDARAGGLADVPTELFALSAKELGYTVYPNYEDDPIPVVNEGLVYAYYNPETGSQDRVKRLSDGNAKNYWTRSADITGSLETAWCVNEDGNLGDNEGYSVATNSNNIYFAPAFVIGNNN